MLSKLKRSEIVKGTLSSIAVKGAGLVFGFMFTMTVTQSYSPTDSGSFFFSIAALSFLSVIARLGLDTNILKRVAALNYTGNSKSIQRLTFLSGCSVFAATITILVTLEIIMLTVPLPESLTGYINSFTLLAFALPSYSIAMFISEALRGLKLIQYSEAVLGVVLPVCALLLMKSFQLFHISTKPEPLYLVACIVAALFGLVIWRAAIGKGGNGLAWQLDINEAKELIKISRRYYVTSIIYQALFPWIPSLILAASASPTDLANYTVCNRLSIIIGAIIIAINSIAAPKYAECFAVNDIEGVRRIANSTTRGMVIVGFPIILVLSVYANSFLNLFGAHYTQSLNVLILLMVAQAFNLLFGPTGYILLMSKFDALFLKSTLTSIVIMSGIGLVLAQSSGALGLAIAVLIATAFTNIYNWFNIKRHIGINTIYTGALAK